MYYGRKYALTQDDKVIIYGAATTGAIIYKNLKKHNLTVVAFVDKRADEIPSYYDLPVWNQEELKSYMESHSDTIVVVGIKNVFEHERVARRLFESGVKKCIFRPFNELNGQGDEKDKQLNLFYNNIMSGRYDGVGYEVNGFQGFELSDCGIIEHNEEYVTAYIHMFYVFTDNYKDKNIMWGDVPCLGLVPHIGLFNFFLGISNEEEKEYIKFCREAATRSGGIVTSEAWEKSVYDNRLDVFNNMQYAWEFDPAFFVKNAVEAEYNERGYFNIKSGKHRIIYQYVKGKRYFPLKIKKEDYLKWRNEDRIRRIVTTLSDLKWDTLPFVSGNPFLYKFPCNATNFYEMATEKFVSLLYKEGYYKNSISFKGKKVLFVGTWAVFYSDIFKHMGMDVSIYESNEERRTLIEKILEQPRCIDEKELESSYNYIVIENNTIDITMNGFDTKLYITHQQEKGNELVSGYCNNCILYAYLEKKRES